MTQMFTRITLSLLLVGGLAAPALADGPKHRPERRDEVSRCGQAYEAAARAAHAPNGPKGNDRKHAMHAAAETKKDCIARARR